MPCGKSFNCERCGRKIPFSGSQRSAVRRHYWKHHKRTMMKSR